MSPPDDRIQELHLTLPPASKPIAKYRPAVQVGNMLYLSGHGPVQQNGSLIKGRIGAELTLEQGYAAARQVGLATLSTVKNTLGTLNKVKRLVKTFGLVLCTPEESGVKGRRRLSFGGHIVVSLAVNASGQVVSGPEAVIEGLPEVEDDDESMSDVVNKTIQGVLRSVPPKRRADVDMLNSAIHRAVRSEVNAFWGRKPNVTVFVHRV